MLDDDRWGDIYEDMPAKRKLALYDYDPQVRRFTLTQNSNQLKGEYFIGCVNSPLQQ